MVFFSRKVLRKISGNWTFVIVTGSEDLDTQIYGNSAKTGAALEDEKRVRAASVENRKRMLNQEDDGAGHGERYPVLSTRSDIIVIPGEAYRRQYDTFAANMRSALPNAAFIGFAGTPLMAGEELTPEVFGDCVQVYNFKESADDVNTVPLYYENRIPELQFTDDSLTGEFASSCDRADLDEDQELKPERESAREYHLITREDRLERVARDIVAYYTGHGVHAKAMVISIDKPTAVRTYDKVRKHWKTALADLREELADADPMDRPELEERLKFFEETGVAVVVSQRSKQRHLPQADREGRPGNEVQERGRSVPHRVRLRHVDHRFRRAVFFHHLH